MIAFTDTETTGLNPLRHSIWEAAVILYDERSRSEVARRTWQLTLTDRELAQADPQGLRIGRFVERRVADAEQVHPEDFVTDFVQLTSGGVHLAGAVPSFDEERIRLLAERWACQPGWHYHLIDVEALAIGFLNGWGRSPFDGNRDDVPAVARSLPWQSSDLTQELGIQIPEESKHTAMGDAEWALAIWKAVTEL